jgi:hypothetical protein
LRQRAGINKGFLDAEPVVPTEPTLSQLINIQQAEAAMDEAWRENTHRNFLRMSPSVPEIRVYIVEAPWHLFDGWWKGLTGIQQTSGLNDDRDPKIKFLNAEEKRIRDLFRELLGDEEFCEHGKTWLEECPICEAAQQLIEKGLDPRLLNKLAVGVKPRQGSYNANKVLAALGLGVNRAKHYGAQGDSAKMAQISAAKQLEEKTGGRRVKPKGIGRDSDAERGEDDSASGTGHTDIEKDFLRDVPAELIDSTSKASDARTYELSPLLNDPGKPDEIAKTVESVEPEESHERDKSLPELLEENEEHLQFVEEDVEQDKEND